SPVTVSYAQRGDTVTVDANGQRVQTSASALRARSGSSMQDFTEKLAHLDLERYVKDVSVDENQMLNGEAVSKVVGVLDTSAFLQDFGTQAASGSGQLPADLRGLLPTVAKEFGDTRVVLYISQ